MRLFIFILIFHFGYSHFGYSQYVVNDSYDCVIIGGQSNGAGAVRYDATSPFIIFSQYVNAFIFDRDALAFQKLSFNPLNNNQQGEKGGVSGKTDYFAFEMNLAQSYWDTTNKPLYIIKSAYGGTSMKVDWNSSTSGEQWTNLKNTYNATYPLLPSNCTVREFIFYQGEQDAAVLNDAQNWDTRMGYLADSLRSLNGLSGIKITIIKIHQNTNKTYTSTVRTSQDNACATITNCECIDSSLFGLGADNIHLTESAQDSLGQYLMRNMDYLTIRKAISFNGNILK